MDYSVLKHSHAGLAYLTVLLFAGRFMLFYFAPVWRRNPLLKILPHVLDTLLLVFAIMLCIRIAQYPLTDAWLTAKVIGLLLYIGFGTAAIKRASRSAFLIALLSYAYVLGVARTHSVVSWFSYF
ncbi:MAG: SirB2 family protein [Saccharospirillaceae bacterium]|nr:SirB2 family protein [Saccharospirillaceae bacterium]MCD8530560.1 SirB2 family protein [Saccharospirillaceae bacterium]